MNDDAPTLPPPGPEGPRPFRSLLDEAPTREPGADGVRVVSAPPAPEPVKISNPVPDLNRDGVNDLRQPWFWRMLLRVGGTVARFFGGPKVDRAADVVQAVGAQVLDAAEDKPRP